MRTFDISHISNMPRSFFSLSFRSDFLLLRLCCKSKSIVESYLMRVLRKMFLGVVSAFDVNKCKT
jgi:hypothetical protein